MRIGQLLKTLLEWMKRLLWSYLGKVPKPFVSVREKQYPLGLLKLVEGRDTLRAIRTWIISPTQSDDTARGDRASQDAPLDIHIYLDFIGSVKGPYSASANPSVFDSSSSSPTATHTITVLKASHRLKYDGSYDYEHLFSGQYDFQGQMITAAEVQARIACDRLAILRGMRYISDLTWPEEVEEVYRQIMGLDGNPRTEAFKFWRSEKPRKTSYRRAIGHSIGYSISSSSSSSGRQPLRRRQRR